MAGDKYPETLKKSGGELSLARQRSRHHCRFPVQCFVKYRIGSFTGTGTVWNLSLSGWLFSGDLLMCRGEILSLNVTLPNDQRIKIQEAIVRWSRGKEFGIETVEVSKHTQDRLAHYVRRLTQAPLL